MITSNDIRRACENYYGYDISVRSRKLDHVVARGIYYYLCKRYTPESLNRIGGSIGYHHASVIHSLRNFRSIMKFYPEYQVEFDEIMLMVRNQRSILEKRASAIRLALHYRKRYYECERNH